MGVAPTEPKKRKLKRTDDATTATSVKAARTAEKEPEPPAAAAADEAVIKAAKKAAKKAALAAGASEAEAKAAGKAAAKAAKAAAKAVGAPVASAEGRSDNDEVAYRAKLQITAGELGDASTLPPCNRSFESTPFVPGVVAALSSSFDAPTPIQAHVVAHPNPIPNPNPDQLPPARRALRPRDEELQPVVVVGVPRAECALSPAARLQDSAAVNDHLLHRRATDEAPPDPRERLHALLALRLERGDPVLDARQEWAEDLLLVLDVLRKTAVACQHAVQLVLRVLVPERQVVARQRRERCALVGSHGCGGTATAHRTRAVFHGLGARTMAARALLHAPCGAASVRYPASQAQRRAGTRGKRKTAQKKVDFENSSQLDALQAPLSRAVEQALLPLDAVPEERVVAA